MKGNNKPSINRRNFVGNTARLIALGSLLSPLGQACNNKKESSAKDNADTTAGRKTKAILKKDRKKWNYESLVINTKTNVLHFPTAILYTYYDEIKPAHLKKTNRAAWNPIAENSPHLNIQQSGNIVEVLTLQELSKGINDTSLDMAANTLSIAFRQEYEKANNMNFRLHELMLQLITLSNSVPADQKWLSFNARVKKPGQLRKRQQWMATEANFNERVNYITQRRSEYISRLGNRAAKYSFN